MTGFSGPKYWRPAGYLPTVSELVALRPGTVIDPECMTTIRQRIMQIRALYATAQGARVKLNSDEPLGAVCLLPMYGDPDFEIAIRCATCDEWLKDNPMDIELSAKQQRAMREMVTFDGDEI